MDLYQQVTDRLVEAIEQSDGKVHLPWHRGSANIFPTNIDTGNGYQGINVLNLWLIAQGRGFSSGTWGTYKQWAGKGCQVRKGEKASHIVFFKEIEVENEGEKEKRRMLRGYAVFNGDQVDGWEPPDVPDHGPIERLEAAEKAVQATKAQIIHGGAQAFYRRSDDTVHMPDEGRFHAENRTEAYYSVLWHELTHWTAPRLQRELGKRFGDEAYAMEELVAELGAAYCCAKLGISTEPREDHAHYIANWLTVFKKDKKAIFQAAARAQEAVDYLL